MKSGGSFLDGIDKAPNDPILGITLAYKADTDPRKLNLGVGAYRTEEGKPYVLSVVRKAEKRIVEDETLDKEYLPIDGLPAFKEASARLIFGADSPALAESRVATCQSISGTGALRIAGEFLARYWTGAKDIYVSDPTWGNHMKIFGDAGFNVKKYTYYDPKTCGLDFDGLLASLKSIADGSIVLLHACAHNPTGVDPTQEQWKSILQVMRSKGHFTLFDFAYHGYATGDLEADAWPIRHWVANGEQMVVCQSYAKNFGLYGERAGTMNVVCSSPGAAEAVLSRIKLVVRPMYSNPPKHGARIVATVLGDADLYAEWQSEIKMMSGRIGDMRTALRSALEELKVPGDWSHITKQIGMFTFTGLSPAQVELLLKDHHVYMLGNGRISMAGLSHKTVPYLAQAIKEVVAATASNL